MRIDRRQAALSACLSTLSSSGPIAPFNTRFSSIVPGAFVRPTSTDQLSAAIRCGSSAGVPVTALSAGHSYTALGLGSQSGALVIDMGAFDDISMTGTIVRAGSRVALGNLAESIYQNGQRALPHGCVGVNYHR